MVAPLLALAALQAQPPATRVATTAESEGAVEAMERQLDLLAQMVPALVDLALESPCGPKAGRAQVLCRGLIAGAACEREVMAKLESALVRGTREQQDTALGFLEDMGGMGDWSVPLLVRHRAKII